MAVVVDPLLEGEGPCRVCRLCPRYRYRPRNSNSKSPHKGLLWIINILRLSTVNDEWLKDMTAKIRSTVFHAPLSFYRSCSQTAQNRVVVVPNQVACVLFLVANWCRDRSGRRADEIMSECCVVRNLTTRSTDRLSGW